MTIPLTDDVSLGATETTILQLSAGAARTANGQAVMAASGSGPAGRLRLYGDSTLIAECLIGGVFDGVKRIYVITPVAISGYATIYLKGDFGAGATGDTAYAENDVNTWLTVH